jgi:predicted RNA methylase
MKQTYLDLGCGTGRLALASAFLGAKSVVGIDINKTAIACSRKLGPNRFKVPTVDSG